MNNIFYVITMKTKNNNTLYLMSDKDKFTWTFNYNECLWFNTESESKKFCKHYFKNFDKWEIKEITYNF